MRMSRLIWQIYSREPKAEPLRFWRNVTIKRRQPHTQHYLRSILVLVRDPKNVTDPNLVLVLARADTRHCHFVREYSCHCRFGFEWSNKVGREYPFNGSCHPTMSYPPGKGSSTREWSVLSPPSRSPAIGSLVRVMILRLFGTKSV